MLDSLAVNPQNDVVDRFIIARKQTEALAAPLSEADAQLQSMPDASPAKWHLAHTTWFFETFILCEYAPNYQRFNERYNYLFNSYYNGIGDQYPRQQRGLISRPSLHEVLEYRQVITSKLLELAEKNANHQPLMELIELGIQHEQQHQELLLTDIKHAFFQNPTFPAYAPHADISASIPTIGSTASSTSTGFALDWLSIDSGMVNIGFDQTGFSFDNERPSHQAYLHPFQLCSALATNGHYLEFIDSGGYQIPEFWLADGWAWLQSNRATRQGVYKHPLYWITRGNDWFEYSLRGLLPIDRQQPLTHISYYEACAYAAWAGARLPTEFEWEAATKHYDITPECIDIKLSPQSLKKKPQALKSESPLEQAFGSAWQWTTSSYSAYPGFSPFEGLAGEYNGKFMSNQSVLRGSSCVTPLGHARTTYRNFFYASQSWQFSGVRLAKNI
ncbi:MAG: ergothioneine biosynthesis protein EgtB [Cellvibrionaceae bacterium]|jgi:ergothioneine biosynthesis protein EgtB